MIKKIMKGTMILLLMLSFSQSMAKCEGHFVNPITDICWRCLFPISIGSMQVVSGENPDTSNPTLPIEVCKMPVGIRVGLNIGYWEPFALTDVTPTPYCLVNLGGIKLNLGFHAGQGGRQMRSPEHNGAFYYAHWYKYPVIYWLQIITSMGCMQTDNFDIAYLTELDPTWNDDELSFIINPEAVLFNSPITQGACAADSIAAQTHLPLDSLFWCAGTQGSMYPLDGTVFDERSPIDAAVLLSERLDFKMHREALIWETKGESGSGFEGPVCHESPSPMMPKSRYRYQMTNTIAAADHCYPFGHMTATWEAGHISPGSSGDFGFLIWRKRNCTFL